MPFATLTCMADIDARTSLPVPACREEPGGNPYPDWVMLGCPAPHGRGVQLWASKEMNYAELKYERDFHQPFFDDPFTILPGTPCITITAGIRTFIVIEAPAYAHAFEELFRQWSADQPDRTPSGSLTGLRALEA